MRTIDVAIAGFGGIGRQVSQLLEARRHRFRAEFGCEVRLTGVCGASAGRCEPAGLVSAGLADRSGWTPGRTDEAFRHCAVRVSAKPHAAMRGIAQTIHGSLVTFTSRGLRPRADRRSANQQERIMAINNDQVKGRTDEAVGTVKEIAGKLVGNKELEVKGNIQKNVGAVQASVGDAKEDLAKVLKKD